MWNKNSTRYSVCFLFKQPTLNEVEYVLKPPLENITWRRFSVLQHWAQITLYFCEKSGTTFKNVMRCFSIIRQIKTVGIASRFILVQPLKRLQFISIWFKNTVWRGVSSFSWEELKTYQAVVSANSTLFWESCGDSLVINH